MRKLLVMLCLAPTQAHDLRSVHLPGSFVEKNPSCFFLATKFQYFFILYPIKYTFRQQVAQAKAKKQIENSLLLHLPPALPELGRTKVDWPANIGDAWLTLSQPNL
jgi:hypothetical protein